MTSSGNRCWAVILAGGSGQRLGSPQPKAFVPVAGQPMIYWSLLAFSAHPDITDLLPIVPAGLEAQVDSEICPRLKLRTEEETPDLRIHPAVAGGERRQDSVRRGLETIAQLDTAPNESFVLLHDAARPVVPSAMIRAVVTELRHTRHHDLPVAVVPAIPAGDTLKNLSAPADRSAQLRGVMGTVGETISREGVLRVQTPQGFPLAAILGAHREAAQTGETFTDDAMLFEKRGWPVRAVAGISLSMKVTYPEDLDLIEAYLGTGGG